MIKEEDNMKLILWIAAILFVLGGCGGYVYTHPTKNMGDFEREKQQCDIAARKTLAAQGRPDT
jgi:hypothetical protein